MFLEINESLYQRGGAPKATNASEQRIVFKAIRDFRYWNLLVTLLINLSSEIYHKVGRQSRTKNERVRTTTTVFLTETSNIEHVNSFDLFSQPTLGEH